MTDSAALPSPPSRFRGPVACRRTANALTLSGAAADAAEGILILTFLSPAPPVLPPSLGAPAVAAVDERHYRIAGASGDWIVETTSLHVHRDVGSAFYRAIPPRPAPLARRIFWRTVMALAGNRAGRRLLLAVRGK
jgi:hypothetical protein